MTFKLTNRRDILPNDFLIIHHNNTLKLKTMTKRNTVRRPVKENNGKSRTPDNAAPENHYGEQTWQQMFILSEHWQSDIAFYDDEIRFLRKVIDGHFSNLVDDKNLPNTRKVTMELINLDKHRFVISQKTDDHLKHLANLLENPFSHNAQTVKDAHAETESMIAGFVKRFRIIKKKIFAIVEQIERSEKGKHLLNP